MKNRTKNVALSAVLASCFLYIIALPHPAEATKNQSGEKSQAVTKTVDSKTVDSKTVDSKPVNSKPVNSKPVNSKPVNSKTTSNKPDEPIYTFKATALDGSQIDFQRYRGDVLLIVNTASECGFTPQYEGLEALNKKYAARGLKILGFPCNQFGDQEPGDSKSIATFCKKNYGVDFQMFEKIDVNGKNANPIYRYLTRSTGNVPIKWNFTKFLLDRHGRLVKRFDSAVTPEDLAKDVEKQLVEKQL